MDISSLKFQDKEHEARFRQILSEYKASVNDRERVILAYLIAVIDEDKVAKRVLKKTEGSFEINPDAVHEPWVTGSWGRLIRLGFNLFNWGCPSALYLEGEEKARELEQYSTADILNWLDERQRAAAVEAIRVWSFWR